MRITRGQAPRSGPSASRRLTQVAAVQGLAIAGLSSLVPAYLTRAGAGDWMVGFAFTAWALMRGSLGLVAGRLYARLGPRRLISLSMALFVLTTLGYALDHRPGILVALRLGQGVAAGLYWTSLLAGTAACAPPERRLAALTRVNVTAAAAGLASNLLAGVVAAALGVGAFFWLEAALLGVVALPLALSLPGEPGRTADRGLAEVAASGPTRSMPLAGRQFAQAGLAAVANLPLVVTGVAVPVLLVRAGAGYRVVGLVAAAMVVAGVLAQLPAQRLAARWGSGRLLAVLAPLSGAALGMLPLARGIGALAALAIILAGLGALTALGWLGWAQEGVAPGSLGAVTGLLRGSGDLMAVAAYSAFGLVAAHLAPALWGLAAVSAATGLGAAALGRASPALPG